MVSKIIESLRGDLAALHEAGAISKVTMREFDAICPPPVRELSAVDIQRLAEVQPAGDCALPAHHGSDGADG
jgi:putative transcriptional regulator